MNTSSHDFVTVDMHGLKAALVARAKEKRCSVSVIVRDAVARDLGQGASLKHAPVTEACEAQTGVAWIKLSVRMARDEALRIDAAAQAAGMSRGAYLVGLSDGVPVLVAGGSRPELIRSLLASCSDLATMSRNIHQLGELLRIGDVQKALDYKQSLDGIDAKVTRHLRIASDVLAELRPAHAGDRRRPSRTSSRRT